MVGWTPDGKLIVFTSARGNGAFPGAKTLWTVSADGGTEQPIDLDWGSWASYSADASKLAFTRHPGVWSRKHYRGSYAVDLWLMDVPASKFTQLADPDYKGNYLWPMYGPKWTPDGEKIVKFPRDLLKNQDKKALIIDQRFNGSGGIDQKLLAILVQRKQYQATVGRNSLPAPRPGQTFFGPLAVLQNERSASDAEMFPDGFRTLGLGKIVGVPTYGAVIGTGSFRLLDGSTMRTPGAGVFTASGRDMENYGVPR